MAVGLKSEFERFLSGFSGECVLFAPNPGNAGDSVIACAEYQIFDRLGINYRIVSHDVSVAETAGEIVFYGGGGNLVDPYPNARDFIARHHEGVKRLVILPHTIAAYPELITALGNNVDIICREQLSHDYVSKFVGVANVHLMDDAAFLLDIQRLRGGGGIAECAWLRRPLRTAKRSVRMWLHAFRNRHQANTLNSFRGDAEGTGRSGARANFDVSQMLAADSMSVADSVLAARSVVKFVERFDVVRTDRLHVCIVSLLLGKEVHFFDNSYGKNRAVYEHSMVGRYARLKWCN